ncbi:MAG: hypothetical protein ACK4NA_00610 [Alphaproteobacteria bacterium]
MQFLADPSTLLLFAGAAVLAFLVGRFGRKLFDYLRGPKAKAPSGPPPSRQVRRAERRKQDKKLRD